MKIFPVNFFEKPYRSESATAKFLKPQNVYEFAEENVFGADCDEMFVHRSTSMNINDLQYDRQPWLDIRKQVLKNSPKNYLHETFILLYAV